MRTVPKTTTSTTYPVPELETYAMRIVANQALTVAVACIGGMIVSQFAWLRKSDISELINVILSMPIIVINALKLFFELFNHEHS